MLLNILTGWNGLTKRDPEEIVVLVSSLDALRRCSVPLICSDRHAYLKTASFSDDINELNIPWDLLRARDFRSDPDDPTKKERYQAEALAYQHVPVAALLGVVCYNVNAKQAVGEAVSSRSLSLPTYDRPGWYRR